MAEDKKYFDFTPDPKILIALTRTPLTPIDALCELIDNSIDGFNLAKIKGISIDDPIIAINIPTTHNIKNNEGMLRIRDNGPGMSQDEAEKAIKAGFSANNPYDSLGLFGLGFNISTGKIGNTTRLLTARKVDSKMTCVTIDLQEIGKRKSYMLPVFEEEKPSDFTSGTIVEISSWWPKGTANSGVIELLAKEIGTVKERVGRRYSTILKDRGIHILINGEKCNLYEHCAWSEERTVDRNGVHIPAKFIFDRVVFSRVRCSNCTAIVEAGYTVCPSCGSGSLRTIEERIRGWVGIQRFDDNNNFGIDLIRNGRAIRVGEKDAFFNFVDELGNTTKDYPIDQITGRIIGEVHLDFVPVDYTKQDFERSSEEWQHAMRFLRGETSLQPRKVGDKGNDSYLYKLYQGYRRCRVAGRKDMYMGYWEGEPKRISRADEKKFYEKFLKKEPGYYDDSKWWEKVEEADKKPPEEMTTCPKCNSQVQKDYDTCVICGEILLEKLCINESCTSKIPLNATFCPICGINQIPVIKHPWKCEICGIENLPDATHCIKCRYEKGRIDPISCEHLLSTSNKDDELSLSSFSISLANGKPSSPMDVSVYVTHDRIKKYGGEEIPLRIFKEINKLQIFIDKKHRLFKSLKPEYAIALETAMTIFDYNKSLSAMPEHNLSNMLWCVANKAWIGALGTESEDVARDIDQFLTEINNRLPSLFGDLAESLFDELTKQQITQLVDQIINHEGDVSRLPEIKRTGEYLKYAPPEFIITLFDTYTDRFFDGRAWTVPYSNIADSIGVAGDDAVRNAQQRIKNMYESCLKDIIVFSSFRPDEQTLVERSRLSLEYLSKKWIP